MTDLVHWAARERHAERLRRRRSEEKNCAYEFLIFGDPEGQPHSARCVFGEADYCSRDYDPLPYAEAEPEDRRFYEDTGIGALYGVPGCERHLWQLVGWNLKPRSTE